MNSDYILEDSGGFFYPMAQMFMRTIQTSSFVDMLTCSDEVQPSTALFYIASILVPRGRAPFGQHQESRLLAWSSGTPFLNGFVNTID